MQLPSSLAWLIDDANMTAGADQFLTELGARLIAEGIPLAGGALTLAAPHPIIARRVWLWRADTGAVIEALGFASLGSAMIEPATAGRDWLVGLGPVFVREDIAGTAADGPLIGWALTQPLSDEQSALLRQVARFAASPLSALAQRATMASLLETYLGRRSAARVLAGHVRRETGETIRAALLYADLRGFTELSEAAAPEAVVTALGAWFDRIAGAVHAFGGEVLKFIGDGVLVIFPVGENPPGLACEQALRAVAAARAGMAHLDAARARQNLPPLPFGMALHLGDILWGNIGTADRLDFTAIGRAVNLVSRLEGLCKPLSRDVLISGAFAGHTEMPLTSLGEHALRGIKEPCLVFTLPGVH